MVQVYYLGMAGPLSEMLADCYREISRDPEYFFEIQFTCVDKRDLSVIPDESPALLLYDLTEKKHETAMARISQINRKSSNFQWVLLTGTEIDYFQIAQTFNIGNILKKNRFDCDVIRTITIRLMTGNIFGFRPYFPNGFLTGPLHKTIYGRTSIRKIMTIFERDFLNQVSIMDTFRLKTYFYELLVNTIAYTVIGMTSEDRDAGAYSVPSEFTISREKPFKFSMAQDSEKCGVSIMDISGTLSLTRILSKFRRQSVIGEEKEPPGVWDITGRGLALILKDNRLIINIVKNAITEIIFLHYKQKAQNKYESILIAEIEN